MSSKGFTLIELLVVITIIAILSTVGISIFSNVSSSVQAVARKTDINAIARAFEAHFDSSSGKYPSVTDIQDSWFASGKIPTPPEGGSYLTQVSSDNNGFRICAGLGGNPGCSETSPTCYCKDSAQGVYVAPAGTPLPTPSPTPGPTPTPTPTPSSFICNVPAPTEFPSPTPGPAAVVVPVSPIPQPGAGTGNCNITNPNIPAGVDSFYALGVTCGGLPQRTAVIAERNPSGTRGGVLFTTGTTGSTFYSTASTAVTTTVGNGFRTFEVCWFGGWPIDNAGWKNSACVYPAVARWIYNNKIQPQSDVMCGTGNSGGSMQNGYGLATYALEDILDLAVLTGGPPTSRADILCFGTIPPIANATDGSMGPNDGGRQLTDSTEGWPGNCVDPTNKPPTQAICTQAQNTSIASPTEYRDYNYPNTKVAFIEGGDDPLRWNGIKYHDLITSNKTWSVLTGVPHAVHTTNAGATAISNSINVDCHNW